MKNKKKCPHDLKHNLTLMMTKMMIMMMIMMIMTIMLMMICHCDVVTLDVVNGACHGDTIDNVVVDLGASGVLNLVPRTAL